ncbi:MAG: hypothetical protein ACP5MG_10290 [Verrucomicrobiia bacterium]
MKKLRIMQPAGEELFKEYHSNLYNSQSQKIPQLDKEPYSLEYIPNIEVDEKKEFKTKEDIAKYLDEIFTTRNADRKDLLSAKNKGIWTYLAYIWFDQLTNNKQNILKRPENYIATDPSKYRRFYIHLVLSPYVIFSQYKSYKEPIWKLFLYNYPYESNDFAERVAPNQFIISHPNIVEAIYHLYFDQEKNIPKKNATSNDIAGNVRRFIKVFQQYELTYDVYSLTAEQIINLLPEEFDPWKNNIPEYI